MWLPILLFQTGPKPIWLLLSGDYAASLCLLSFTHATSCNQITKILLVPTMKLLGRTEKYRERSRVQSLLYRILYPE